MAIKHSTLNALFLVLIFQIVGCTTAEDTSPQGDVALVAVNVVDIEAGTILPSQTLIIADGRIVEMLPSEEVALPHGMHSVRGNSLYLIPGLMDMHTHVASPEGLALALAHGVTTIRIMWGQPATLALRESVRGGEIPGPRIYTAGDLVDGHPAIWAEVGLEANAYTDAQAMDAFVAQQQADGYDFIKTYSRLTPEVFQAILAAGNKHGMEVSGHVPQDVSLREAIEGGMRTSEHFIGALASVLRDESLPSPDLSVFDERALDLVRKVGSGEIDASELIDPEKLDAFAAYVATQDHWFVPTHDIMRNFTNDFQRPFEEALPYMTPDLHAMFESIESGSFFRLDQVQKDGESTLYELRTLVLSAFHDAGAKILVGTDHSFLSGPATAREIKALHKAGFSRHAALAAATIEPGRYLGQAGELGVIAKGAVADLVLLDGNPLEDLDALNHIEGVMTEGVWYDRAALDAMLVELERRASGEE